MKRSSCPGLGEGGSLAVEIVVLAPVFLVFVFAIVGMTRVEAARQEIIGAARGAAQAASGALDGPDAQAVAQMEAMPTFSGGRRTCLDPIVSTDTSAFVPGGSVAVTISCRIDLSDVLVPGMPGSIVVRTRQSAPIDRYRGFG